MEQFWSNRIYLKCQGQFDWIHPKTIAREDNYGKRKI